MNFVYSTTPERTRTVMGLSQIAYLRILNVIAGIGGLLRVHSKVYYYPVEEEQCIFRFPIVKS